jgi:hypothetical protein
MSKSTRTKMYALRSPSFGSPSNGTTSLQVQRDSGHADFLTQGFKPAYYAHHTYSRTTQDSGASMLLNDDPADTLTTRGTAMVTSIAIAHIRHQSSLSTFPSFLFANCDYLSSLYSSSLTDIR